MATKTSKTATANKATTGGELVAKFTDAPEMGKATALAKMAVQPSVNAAAVMVEYAKPFGEQHVGALADSLVEGIDKLTAGDLSRCEAMLYGQAHALQAIFMNFSRRALNQEYQQNLEAFLRMALKAQNQCRMTLETLATIKNPPVVFARQANIAHGPQQVNNAAPDQYARASQIASQQIEVLEPAKADDSRCDNFQVNELGMTT